MLLVVFHVLKENLITAILAKTRIPITVLGIVLSEKQLNDVVLLVVFHVLKENLISVLLVETRIQNTVLGIVLLEKGKSTSDNAGESER